MNEDLPPGIIEIVKEYKVPIIIGAASLFAITLSIILLVKSVAATTPIQFSSDRSASDSALLGDSVIKIDIEGAIIHAGLYSLPEGSRVEDAIIASGGLSDDVDEGALAKTINRAMKLVDGAKIFIPGRSDNPGAESVQGVSQTNSLISVNSATESQLDTLSGVGPVTAKIIIDNRPYQTLDELVSKKAVGQALFEKIKSQISL